MERVRQRLDARTGWWWAAALIAMGCCVAVVAWFPLAALTSLPSLNYNEGWNAYRQQMAFLGQPLYGQPPTLWITNYPFLSFHIIGALGGRIGNMVVAGRILAFISLVLIAVFSGGIVKAMTHSSRGGIYAGLCLFLWIATFTPDRRAMDDPELL